MTVILSFLTKLDSSTYLEKNGQKCGSFFSHLAAWDGEKHGCWVYEDAQEWIPSFMKDLEPNDDLISSESQKNIGHVENEVDPSNHDVGLDNSDPLIDEVMAQSNSDRAKEKEVTEEKTSRALKFGVVNTLEKIPDYQI
ncbi:hypothetical protein QVD17_24760 [Tagetes erecta]|uniref:Uncharacterized protein n=1 Tax=Tagetes erecta TaxID=13708 RepID=A0AAD8KFR0_TARER|nr:hypothetical protein QVD17_24760 [Tagetes erecta]